MSLFADTSALYAAADAGDRSHRRATEILSGGDRIVITDHILVETWTLVGGRLGRDAAEQLWSGIRRGAAHVENVLPGDLDVAWQVGQTFSDQDFSIVDRTSFAVMERLGIHRVASFDAHFAIYRFGIRRERAFEVLA